MQTYHYKSKLSKWLYVEIIDVLCCVKVIVEQTR